MWMREQKRPFTSQQVRDGIRINADRDAVRSAIRDFVRRGEVIPHGHSHLAYVTGWKSPYQGLSMRSKIVKAMYVSGRAFTAADIKKLSECPDINYVQKTIRKLQRSGHLHSAGKHRAWTLYRVKSMEKFKVEVMA